MGSSQSYCKYGDGCQGAQIKSSEFCGKHTCRRDHCYSIIKDDKASYCHDHNCRKKDCFEYAIGTYCVNH